jgi:hypothetical protein
MRPASENSEPEVGKSPPTQLPAIRMSIPSIISARCKGFSSSKSKAMIHGNAAIARRDFLAVIGEGRFERQSPGPRVIADRANIRRFRPV